MTTTQTLAAEFPTTADREAEIARLSDLAIDFADQAEAAEEAGQPTADLEALADQCHDRARQIRNL